MNSPVVDTRSGDAVDGPTFLDRGLDLGAVRWGAVAWIVAIAVAITIRLARLDVWALSPDEARRAYDGWILFQGRPSLPGESLPQAGPLFALMQSLSFFLFGATDVTARLMPAVAGLAIVALCSMLRPFVGGTAALGMAVLAAFSPSLVYASRSATPEILVAGLSLLVLVAVLRAGMTGIAHEGTRRWGIAAGAALGALFASGPSSITVILSLGIGMVVAATLERDGAVDQGLRALATSPGALPALMAGLLATLLVLFTRFFSDLPAIAGVGTTFADWGRLLAEQSAGTPTQFFLLALLLYEPLAVLLAVVAILRGRINRSGGLSWPLFAGWFVAALLLWSFSSGGAPQHAVQVALPLVLLAGGVLGDVIAAVNRRDALRGMGGGLVLAFLGILVGLISVAILLSRVDSALDQRAATLQAIIVAMLVVVPLGYAAFVLTRAERDAGRGRQPWLLALLVPVVLLGAFTLRSSVLLNFYRADMGTELLAQRLPTEAVRPLVDGIERLGRDVTVTQGSVQDTTGGHGLSIVAGRSARWPFQWYFREFPNFSVVDPGQELRTEAQVVIAADDAGMAEAGYTPRTFAWLNRVPPAYAAPATATILETAILPDRWLTGARYLLYREGLEPGAAETIALGLNGELAARVYPASGPYGLNDRPGPGTGRGQFNGPVGIAAAPDDTIYVVDQGNARVERFDGSGGFVGIWGGDDSKVTFARTETGLGPTGIAVGQDGLVYVADTWNHRVVVLSSDGELIREIGGPPDAEGARVAADTSDDPAAVATKRGQFFGPRAVAVSRDELYVVDTGNERIQVFGIDGTFKRVWGGYGHGPGQLIEPGGIAIGPDGLIYVADAGNARISIFTPAGEPLAQWPVKAWPAPDAAGARPGFQPYLAFDKDGKLYVSSSETGSVEVLDRAGALVRSIDKVGADKLQQPVGVGAAPNGEMLITDLAASAIYRYAPPAAPPLAQIIARPGSPTEMRPSSGDAAPTSGTLPPPPS